VVYVGKILTKQTEDEESSGTQLTTRYMRRRIYQANSAFHPSGSVNE